MTTELPDRGTPVVAAIILAAGSSTRLGQPKQLLELDGKILLQHVVDAAAGAPFDEIVIVLGHRATTIENALELPANARVVVNRDHVRGQSSSLRAGVDALDERTEVVAVLLGDQPRLSTAAIRRALEAFRRSSTPVLRSTWAGKPGHPVVFSRSVWERFEEVSGDKGARDLIAASDDVVTLEMDEGAVIDVDTWDQFRTLGGEVPEGSLGNSD